MTFDKIPNKKKVIVTYFVCLVGLWGKWDSVVLLKNCSRKQQFIRNFYGNYVVFRKMQLPFEKKD